MAARSLILLWLVLPAAFRAPDPVLHRSFDLDVGEEAVGEFPEGPKFRVRVLGVEETADEINSSVREVRVRLEVNGESATLRSATYHLPRTVGGLQIDCPITQGYLRNARKNWWGLQKAVRVRVWPAGSPMLPPGTFSYPARQRWFPTYTQMSNEPCYIGGDEVPGHQKIYYHYGLDIGGSEGLVDVVAATDGIVASSGKEVLAGQEKGTPVDKRYDVIYVIDRRGWYYRYSHLKFIEDWVRPGAAVAQGRKLGVLGKEGGSGGWSHLHFDITCRQPSGEWGIEDGYAFLWEAYRRERAPKLMAVARPHHVIWAGQKVELDGSLSMGTDLRFEWRFSDGSTAAGARVERAYPAPGEYAEILKISDAEGRIDYDFGVVQVFDREHPDRLPPAIHATYAPTFGIRPDDPVLFKVRTFRDREGGETWDFGDGSPAVTVKSDANADQHAPNGYAEAIHKYARPGHYLASVEHTNADGVKAVARLQIRVGEE